MAINYSELRVNIFNIRLNKGLCNAIFTASEQEQKVGSFSPETDQFRNKKRPFLERFSDHEN